MSTINLFSLILHDNPLNHDNVEILRDYDPFIFPKYKNVPYRF